MALCDALASNLTVPGRIGLPPEVGDDQITATSAVVRWSPPEDPNGIVISYTVNYKVISSDPGATRGGRSKRETDIVMECIIGGDIDGNITVGSATVARLTGLSKQIKPSIILIITCMIVCYYCQL